MAFPFYKNVHTADSVLSRIQSSLKECIDFIMTRPGIRGIELNVDVKTGANAIQHTLGNVPKGYYIVSSNADVRVWNTVPNTSSTLNIQSSGNATITLIVY
jgi:hypothetical protein